MIATPVDFSATAEQPSSPEPQDRLEIHIQYFLKFCSTSSIMLHLKYGTRPSILADIRREVFHFVQDLAHQDKPPQNISGRP